MMDTRWLPDRVITIVIKSHASKLSLLTQVLMTRVITTTESHQVSNRTCETLQPNTQRRQTHDIYTEADGHCHAADPRTRCTNLLVKPLLRPRASNVPLAMTTMEPCIGLFRLHCCLKRLMQGWCEADASAMEVYT